MRSGNIFVTTELLSFSLVATQLFHSMFFTKPDYSLNPSPRLTATEILEQQALSRSLFRAQKTNTAIIKQFLEPTC